MHCVIASLFLFFKTMDRPPPLRSLPFVSEDTNTLWKQCVAFSQHYVTEWKSCQDHKIRQALDSYSKQRALNLVWHSNQLEGTLSHGISERQTYKVLEELYTSHLTQTDPAADVERIDDAEHESDAEKDRLGKLSQHMRAFLLCRREAEQRTPLTERLIQNIHGILMNEKRTEDNAPINAGNYRLESVHAGEYMFLEHKYIPDAMSKVVKEYNTKSASDDHDPYQLASWLLYRVVTIHPFQDGNGRLCRLLAAYSLMRDGLPFPVTISSGHRRAHKHYVGAITRDRDRSQKKPSSFDNTDPV